VLGAYRGGWYNFKVCSIVLFVRSARNLGAKSVCISELLKLSLLLNNGSTNNLFGTGVKIKLRKGKSSSRHHEEKGEEKIERDNARSDSSARPGSGGCQQHSHTGGLDTAGSPRGGLLPPRRGGTGREAPAAPARRRSTLHSVGLVSPGGSSTMSEQRPGEGGFWKQLFYQGSTKKAATSKKSS